MGFVEQMKGLRDRWVERHAAKLPLSPPQETGPAVRERVRISGRVQHVGFRYEAYLLAGRLGLSGWICNNDDGSVEFEAQGPPGGVDALLDALGSISRFRLDKIERTQIAPKRDEREFTMLS